MNKYENIYVFIEQRDGNIVHIGYELLGEAARLAVVSNMKVCAILLENDDDIVLNKLIQFGADEVHILTKHSKVNYREDIAIQLIKNFIRDKIPDILLIGSTIFGKSFAAGLAGQLKTGLTADCTALQMKEGLLWQRRPAFDGDMFATIICRHKRPQMATIRPGVMKPIRADKKRTGIICRHNIGYIIDKPYEIVKSVPLSINDNKLEKAKIIVAIGMGIAHQKNIEELQLKANKIGAVIGATRPVVDSGLLPVKCQIGLTGTSIHPELYIACGISGSAQHISGLSAKCIIAVNTDINAPIFRIAQYGVVDDAMTVVPQLLEKIGRKMQNKI